MTREATVERNTKETKIAIKLNLDGTGKYKNDTKIGFLNHMLDLFTKHGRFDMEVICNGDIDVDYHHSVEDIGIVIGKCFADILGYVRGINRYGNFYMPMDEALTLVAVDICGRSYLKFDVDIPTQKVGSFDTELVK